MVDIDFAKNLRKIRLSNQLTQKDLAEKLEMNKNTIYFWEKGRCLPDLVSLRKLTKMFGNEILNY